MATERKQKAESKKQKAESKEQKAESREQKAESGEKKRAQNAERGARKMVKVRQVKSGIGCPPSMRETLKALGLRRMHQIVERKDSPEARGMIAKIRHLVEVVD